ncbi:MAG TPA: hypothetical protein VEU09_08540 [Candidatus Binatia bacterium]|nr:hypothetical protein [Candidatus Binatia bacterium]
MNWRAAALWFLLALAAGILFANAAHPNIAPASDLWDYSQEARQLARGEGFTSLYTYPVFLGHDEPPFPVRWRMPLYAVLGALLLKLGIALPAGFLYLSALAHALLVALTYRLGSRLHSPRAGSWAAACALACPLLLDFYSPGMSQGPAAVLDLCVWLLLLGSGGAVAAALAGVAAAGSWYLRAESFLFVPIWIWIATRSPAGTPRWSRAAVFAAVYAALCVPWLIAASRGGAGGTIQGNPMLLYTAQYPGYSSSRMLNAALPGMLEYVARHPGAFALRVAKDIAGYILDLLDGIGPVALGIAVAGIAIAGGRHVGTLARRHAWLLVAIALQILAMSALERSPRFLVPILPLAFALIGAAAEPALARLAQNRALVALLLLVVLERGVRVVYQRGDARRRFPPVAASTAPELADRARDWPRGGLVLSDAPDWIAWHLDRPAVLLPLRTQMDSLAASRPVAAIWLSPEARQRNVADGDAAWVRVIDGGEAIPGFKGPEAVPGGSRVYSMP